MMTYLKTLILFKIKSVLISKKKFDSNPVCNKSFSKTKIKSYNDKVTDFYNKEIPQVDSNHTWLAEIILDSALEKADSYYAQVFKIVKIHREKSS